MPNAEALSRPTLVVTIDGLRAASLGAYGQTAYETPAFDRLAAEATTYGEVFAPTPDPRDLYAWLASSGSIPPDSVLVTDDPGITGPFGKAFGRVEVVDSPAPSTIAATIDQTATAQTWSDFAVTMVELFGERDEPTPLVWFHTRGLGGPWDAPAENYAKLIEEDDPAVSPDPQRPEGEIDHDDARFAAACRYAGQVMTLDACLAGWLDLADGLFEGEEHRLIVAGVRGYALGEHGRVGMNDERLFSELQHVPLLIREPGPDRRFTREAAPTSLDAVLATLGTNANQSGSVLLSSAAGAAAVITAERMLRLPADSAAVAELYVKPDDRWEQNDIASLEPDAADELLARLPGSDSAVAVPSDDP